MDSREEKKEERNEIEGIVSLVRTLYKGKEKKLISPPQYPPLDLALTEAIIRKIIRL